MRFGTRKAEVLNSLITKITATENDINNILQIRNTLTIITGVIETFAICP